MADPVQKKREPRLIPDGEWQRWTALGLAGLGFLLVIVSSADPSAASFATVCFTLAGGFGFWGVMLRYLGILEGKLARLLEDREAGS